jgi:hypothetical protein
MFSRSVGLEYRQHGIDIQCQVLSSFLSFFQGILFLFQGKGRIGGKPGRGDNKNLFLYLNCGWIYIGLLDI